jgi:WD40 repeat protein
VRGCVVTPDGRRLITGGGFFLGTPPGGQIIVWDTATGKALHQIDDVSLGIQDLTISPDGKQLAAACASGEVKVWLLESLQLPPKIMPNEAGNVPHAIAFSPDGKRLAAACMKASTQVWDLESNQVRRLLIHRGNASGVAFSPNGKWLATTGRDHIVHVLDANTLAEIRRFDAYANATRLRFSPDSRRLAVGTYRGQVFVWDLGPGTESKWTYAADQSYIRSLHFTPDGLHLGICFHAGPARLVNLANSTTAAEFRGHERGVMRMAFSSDGRFVYTAGIDGKVRKWDLASRREPYEFYVHPGFVYEIAFSPDGRYLLIPGGYNPTLRGIDDQKTLVRRRLGDAHQVAVKVISFDLCGKGGSRPEDIAVDSCTVIAGADVIVQNAYRKFVARGAAEVHERYSDRWACAGELDVVIGNHDAVAVVANLDGNLIRDIATKRVVMDLRVAGVCQYEHELRHKWSNWSRQLRSGRRLEQSGNQQGW